MSRSSVRTAGLSGTPVTRRSASARRSGPKKGCLELSQPNKRWNLERLKVTDTFFGQSHAAQYLRKQVGRVRVTQLVGSLDPLTGQSPASPVRGSAGLIR